MAEGRDRNRSSAFGRALGWAVTSVAVWLMAAAKVDASELTFAASMGVLAALLAHRLDAHGLAWLRRASPPARLGAAVPQGVVRDLGIVLRALARVLSADHLRPDVLGGRIAEVDFEAGTDDAPSEARRALVVGLASLSPNTIALTVDTERGGTLVVHQLVASGVKGGPKWPL